MNGHFHEDAYILFTYVENLTRGYGITYYPGGSPTEGATDFLWLILLSVLTYSGISCGTSSICLNAIGVYIVSVIFFNHKSESAKYYFGIVFIVIWIFSRQFSAAVGGFSVNLYSAVCLVIFSINLDIIIKKNIDKYYYLPYIWLILSLFRPDGLLICLGSFVCILSSLGAINRRFLFHLLVVFFLGSIYFIWRYNYFGYLLPLPLYVKSHTETGLGSNENLEWMGKHFFIIVPLLIVIAYQNFICVKDFVTWYLCILFLFVALFFVENSQNIGYRFQAPFLIMLLFSLYLLFQHVKGKVYIFLYIFLLIAVVHNVKYTIKSYHTICDFNYINSAPKEIYNILPENSVVALTEAGRLSYWNRTNKIIDLVGLNTSEFAIHDLKSSDIEKIQPSILMFYNSDLLVLSKHIDQRNPIINITNKIDQIIIAYNKFNKKAKTDVAGQESIKFMLKNADKYDVFLIDYSLDKKYRHVFLIKKNLKISNEFYEIILKIFRERKNPSYYQIYKEVYN